MRNMVSRLLLAGAATLALSSMAHAAFIIDDWTFDATAVGPEGLVGGTIGGEQQHIVMDIEQLTFLASFRSVTNDTNGNFIPDVGETFNVQANGTVTEFFSGGGGNVSPTLFNSTLTLPADGGGTLDGWELAFTFNVNGMFISNDGVDANFVHIASPSPALVFYLDNIAGGTGANTQTGAGVTDGTIVATFDLVVGDGGVFSFLTGDGSDDATFVLTSNPFGAFKNGSGNPLAVGATLGLSDGNFDSDAGAGPFTSNFSAFTCGFSPVDFCGEEDGSFRLAIPEPTSVALIGLGLLGMAASIRRRKSRV